MVLALRDIFKHLKLAVFDYVIIVFVLALSLTLIVCFSDNQSGAQQCVIEVDGKEYARFDMTLLTEEKVIDIDSQYGRNVVVIDRGGVSVTESSCPDGSEVKSGRITKPGQSLICLPNRVVVRLEGNSGVDAVAW